MNKDRLRVVVAGCGSIGRRHIANLLQLTQDQSAAIAVYDPSPSARRGAAQAFGVCALSELEELWEMRPHIALICSPSPLHTEQAFAAAQAGAALFIEKPVSHQLDGLGELAGLTTARGLTTLVGCNMRFHPGPAQLKAWLDAGRIGEPISARLHTGSYLPGWRPGQDWRSSYSASPAHGGAILDCIHELDLACWLLGPANLHCALVRPAASLGLQTDGLAELLLTHTAGGISSVHLNFVQRNYERRITVIGSEGTLSWDFNTGESLLYNAQGRVEECIPQPPDWTINQMYRDELAYFLNCARRGAPTCNDINTAADTLRIALGARGAQEAQAWG